MSSIKSIIALVFLEKGHWGLPTAKPVTEMDHALQCAHLAKNRPAPAEGRYRTAALLPRHSGIFSATGLPGEHRGQPTRNRWPATKTAQAPLGSAKHFSPAPPPSPSNPVRLPRSPPKTLPFAPWTPTYPKRPFPPASILSLKTPKGGPMSPRRNSANSEAEPPFSAPALRRSPLGRGRQGSRFSRKFSWNRGHYRPAPLEAVQQSKLEPPLTSKVRKISANGRNYTRHPFLHGFFK